MNCYSEEAFQTRWKEIVAALQTSNQGIDTLKSTDTLSERRKKLWNALRYVVPPRMRCITKVIRACAGNSGTLSEN